MRRHRRFNWQCPDCYDRGPHRDELDAPFHLYEGTRRSQGPVCDQDEGIDADEETRLRFTLRDQRDRSNYWRVTFPSNVFTWDTGESPAVEGWIVDGVWTVYFAGGLLQYDTRLIKGAIEAPSNLNLTIVGGILQWGPIT